MSEHASETIQRPPMSESARKRMLAGQERGRETVRQAIALKAQMDNGQSALEEARQIARNAMPAATKHMAAIATGKIAKAPAAARVMATKLLAEIGQAALGAPMGGTSGGIGEMSLSELEQVLRSTADAARDLAAIESQSQRIDDADEVVPSLGAADDGAAPEAP